MHSKQLFFFLVICLIVYEKSKTQTKKNKEKKLLQEVNSTYDLLVFLLLCSTCMRFRLHMYMLGTHVYSATEWNKTRQLQSI